MKIAGIDLSLTSPSICVFDGDVFSFEQCNFYYLTGSKKSVIEDFGGFKPSIKLTFIYEFLLRLTYNSVSIMTVPKLGYKHTNLREGSIFWNYKFGEEKISDDEVSFWLESAKKRTFF